MNKLVVFPFSLMLMKSDDLFEKTPTLLEYLQQGPLDSEEGTFQPARFFSLI